jgi:hypothetical protein
VFSFLEKCAQGIQENTVLYLPALINITSGASDLFSVSILLAQHKT